MSRKRKRSSKISEGKLTEQYVDKYLQNDIEKVSIHMLNDDCLRHIFRLLPIKDRVRIERVCKRWRDLSQDSWCPMKTLDISTWGFKYNYQINRVLSKKLLKCGKSVTRIINDPLCNVKISTLTIIGKLCPNLTDIDVTHIDITAPGIRTLTTNCKNITKFKLGPSTDNCDEELEYLFKLHKNLKYLAITESNILGKCLLHLPEQTVHTIILDNCRQLQDNHLAMAIKKLENVEHLAINLCTGIAEHTLEAISHCKNLKTLEISYFQCASANMLYYNLYHLVNLQVLKITHSNGVSDDFLIGLVQHCQQLSNIDIEGCWNVSDAGLTAIATLARLEKLNVNYIFDITHDGFKNLCNLKELKCRRCQFTNQSMITLIKSSPQLQLLDLCECRYIGKTVLNIAIDECRSRTNNVMLKMLVWQTAIWKNRRKNQGELPPLLHILYNY